MCCLYGGDCTKLPEEVSMPRPLCGGRGWVDCWLIHVLTFQLCRVSQCLHLDFASSWVKKSLLFYCHTSPLKAESTPVKLQTKARGLLICFHHLTWHRNQNTAFWKKKLGLWNCKTHDLVTEEEASVEETAIEEIRAAMQLLNTTVLQQTSTIESINATVQEQKEAINECKADIQTLNKTKGKSVILRKWHSISHIVLHLCPRLTDWVSQFYHDMGFTPHPAVCCQHRNVAAMLESGSSTCVIIFLSA